jgi:site-specific recombinase XerC
LSTQHFSSIEGHITNLGKTRWVPFGPVLDRALAHYVARARTPAAEAAFFTTRAGTRVKPDTIQHNFRVLCARAGITRSDGGRYQPRLHDLRHTFAVHRLTSWYQQGADVQRLVHHPSVYLGHSHLSDTQVYLTMTPELLQQAGLRFERYARGEDNHA